MWALIRHDGMPPEVQSTEIERGDDLPRLYAQRDYWNQIALTRKGSFARRRYAVMPVEECAMAAGGKA